jgi:LAO/AO transport system kinase
MKADGNEVKRLIDGLFAGNVRALTRLMTLVENRADLLPVIMGEIYTRRKPARRIGIAGPPGAGKSTLLSNLIRAGVDRELRVAALCIDPTSPISGGAILGDRIRIADIAGLKDVFVRSVASGESLGGLAEATKYHTLLLEAFGFDLVLIETVGLGQVGYDIRNIAETLILLLVPESGDTVQILKSGIIELADIVVVNKADRAGAEEIATTLDLTFEESRDGWKIPVIRAIARDGAGTEEIWKSADEHVEYLKRTGRLGRYRDPGADLREALEFQFQREVAAGLLDKNSAAGEIARNVKDGKTDPYSAAVKIMKLLFENRKK